MCMGACKLALVFQMLAGLWWRNRSGASVSATDPTPQEAAKPCTASSMPAADWLLAHPKVVIIRLSHAQLEQSAS